MENYLVLLNLHYFRGQLFQTGFMAHLWTHIVNGKLSQPLLTIMDKKPYKTSSWRNDNLKRLLNDEKLIGFKVC